MFSKVLVAVDGSPESDHAFVDAVDIAISHGAELTILTVKLLPGADAIPGERLERMFPEVADEARQLLAELRLRVPPDVPTHTMLAWGHPAKCIVAYAQAGGHDLVVLGTRGRGAFASTVLGSVGQAVLHHCAVPVLIVHGTSDMTAVRGGERLKASAAR